MPNKIENRREVVRRFLSHQCFKSGNFWCTPNTIFSYETVLAKRVGDVVKVVTKSSLQARNKYSVTTAEHYSAVVSNTPQPMIEFVDEELTDLPALFSRGT